MEKEENQKISFLDVTLTRISGKIDISVYRKATNTDRYITNDSFSPINTKRSAFNSMVYRMCRLPLTATNYMKELEKIKQIAKTNGYTEKLINDLVEKHCQQLKKKQFSTFFEQQKQKPIYKSFNFIPKITNHLKPIFEKHGIKLALSNSNKISNILGNTKDKIGSLAKPGIYKIVCGDCNKIYIGQTRREIQIRFKEHCQHIKYNRPSKSAVASHALNSNPVHFNIRTEQLSLIKQVRKRNQLDAWESIYMKKYKDNTMNIDSPPITSCLFNMIKYKQE